MLLLAAGAAGPAPHWSANLPFALLLLAIALLPLIARTEHWWHSNRNKLLVSLGLSLVVLGYYLLRPTGYHGAATGLPSVLAVLDHALVLEYLPFIVLLFSLYVIAGGLLIRTHVAPTPLANTAVLAFGGLIASFVGTTGASIALVRVILHNNAARKRNVHTVVFFIFIVSNIGGSLLPIGDPPLFLGYLKGVPFLWTLNLLVPWAVAVGVLLVIYFLWDTFAYRADLRENPGLATARHTPGRPMLTLRGSVNVLLLLLAVLAVATLDPSKPFPGTEWHAPRFLREGLLLALTGLSLLLTTADTRRENHFNYVAIGEVAALFIGIFITMQPALELLRTMGPQFTAWDFTHPAQYFWATGILTSFLDNAPTYAVFLEIAQQLTPTGGAGTVDLIGSGHVRHDLLKAISVGAVFMGANTYIGNGPNFMVKSIAEQGGVKMPSFFGYMGYAALILLPLFAGLTLLRFWTFSTI